MKIDTISPAIVIPNFQLSWKISYVFFKIYAFTWSSSMVLSRNFTYLETMNST